MSFWVFFKHSLQFMFLGVSLYAASFVVSLLFGFGANHPVLGPSNILFSHLQNIALSAVGIAFSLQLASSTTSSTLKRA